ncbi:hypothetical protein EZV62_010219 [Acer yangbiense]|uniref:Autophagy-related protein n=1 Tax=Acer yangbiense TaxID=1000413 RepID=A0A5C7I2C5_9ROSI|nr:hypothetical protein EZV62_010219 [Acer yangbiense]
MGKTTFFKDEFTFEERLAESRDIIGQYADRVPVIAERYSKAADLPNIEKKNPVLIKQTVFLVWLNQDKRCFIVIAMVSHAVVIDRVKLLVEKLLDVKFYLMSWTHPVCKTVALAGAMLKYPQPRFLVPRDMSVGQFIHVLSNRLRLTPGKALFVFVKDTLPQTGELLSWTQYTNPSRMKMDFCICATALRKPLVKLESRLVNIELCTLL